jgi:hypothetical protein
MISKQDEALAGGVTPSSSKKSKSAGDDEDASWEKRLVLRCAEYVARADANEDARRKSDRIGANLMYGRHWNVPMPSTRAALTVNFTKALILHKLAIMTKQDPIPVIEPTEFGDAKASKLLRQVMMKWWREKNMKTKLRKAELLANSTRTCSWKISWDPTDNGGVGDVTCDVIPGWRLILDDRADTTHRMQFVGHRETLLRSEAALLYEESAEKIYAGAEDGKRGKMHSGGSMPQSPLGDPWRRMAATNQNLGTIVNGRPVISAYSMTGPSAKPQFSNEDSVQIIELFHRDRTLVRKDVQVYDVSGNPRKKIARDDEGIPQFEPAEEEQHPQPDGTTVTLPGFKLRMEPVMEKRLVPKYPHWRRTTFLLPDLVLVDDRAWDGPVPHALFSDGEALEGPWVKGCALDCEDIQMSLNVSLSIMMDNLRYSSLRPVLAGQGSNIEQNTLLVKPGQVVRVGKVSEVQPFEFPQLSETWFQWCNFMVSNMERIVGATGIMQGEAAGRVDSAAGYDLLAEIGGSRLVAETKRMEQSVVEAMRIAAWFMQRRYTEAHAVAVTDSEGNISEEKLGGAFLLGTFNFDIVTGSTMAWSESSVRARLLQELQNGIIDKVAYWQRTNTPDWQQIQERILHQPPALSGAAASPPPRTRSAPKNASKVPRVAA